MRLDPRVRPFFVGARRGVERDVLPKTEFPHLLLDLHPLYRPRVWQNWKTIAGALSSWGALNAMLREERPRLVVGTGGYAMGIAALHARLRGLPFVQQAGDSVPGITARITSRWSREIYLAFPEAARVLPTAARSAVHDTGAPIEPPPASRPDRAAARRAWGFPETGGHVLLMYGGSQGSRAMNDVVAAWVRAGLPDGLYLLWGTGKLTHAEYAELESERVKVRAYLSPIADAYAAADVALARAGAMATSELLAWGIPPILVPLPTAAADHQTTNAVALASAGAAVHIPQRELTLARLDTAVRQLISDPTAIPRLTRAAQARARPDAAETIARRILDLLAEQPAPA